ncbi:MAG: hypothetical protein SO010_03105, partial [Candidatus Limiplasma sp.]|nr:hypothetical protein [Clostridiales bacterium]MDY3244884.1 hypothetical protein [Candidatus Limiplasma sp.]MDY4061883.1 hypothetical protein [Candidatus Limiplasma sp.]
GASDAFSAIRCLQNSRFTSSKPSSFAIASDKKCTRYRATSFVRHCLKNKTGKEQRRTFSGLLF